MNGFESMVSSIKVATFYTSGPPESLLDGSPLMTYAETNGDTTIDAQLEAIESLENDTPILSTESKAVESEETDMPSESSYIAPAETLNATTDHSPVRRSADVLSKSGSLVEKEHRQEEEVPRCGYETMRMQSDPVDHHPTSDDTGITPSYLTPRDYLLGMVLVAKCPLAGTSKTRLEAEKGDRIKILKFVSGIYYLGLNLKTKQTGQIPMKFSIASLPTLTTPDGVFDQRKTKLIRSDLHRLDNIEATSAAEWDAPQVLLPSNYSYQVQAPSSPPTLDGRQSSESKTKSRSSASAADCSSVADNDSHKVTRKEMESLFEEKVIMTPLAMQPKSDLSTAR